MRLACCGSERTRSARPSSDMIIQYTCGTLADCEHAHETDWRLGAPADCREVGHVEAAVTDPALHRTLRLIGGFVPRRR
jgi:hypothetical protein